MCGFWMQNSDYRTRITSLCRWIDPTCGFCMQNSDFWTRVTSLYGSQTWLFILLNIRITSLYGSQPSSVVFACKTAWLASESLVSIGPSPHVWFMDAKQRLLDRNNKSLWVPDITCRFVQAIQGDLYQNNLSLLVPTLICSFCMQNSDFWSRITSLYGSQTWPIVLCIQNSVIRIRIISLYGSQPSSVVFACKTATLGPDLQMCMGPRPHLWFWVHITACLAQE